MSLLPLELQCELFECLDVAASKRLISLSRQIATLNRNALVRKAKGWRVWTNSIPVEAEPFSQELCEPFNTDRFPRTIAHATLETCCGRTSTVVKWLEKMKKQTAEVNAWLAEADPIRLAPWSPEPLTMGEHRGCTLIIRMKTELLKEFCGIISGFEFERRIDGEHIDVPEWVQTMDGRRVRLLMDQYREWATKGEPAQKWRVVRDQWLMVAVDQWDLALQEWHCAANKWLDRLIEDEEK